MRNPFQYDTSVFLFYLTLVSIKPILPQYIFRHSLQYIKRIHYKFGILMMVIGDLDKAISSFENALAINPTFYRALSKLAVCLCESGREEMALKRLTQTDPIPRDMFELHYRTAILYCDKQKFAEALCTMNDTMRANFTQSDALVNIEVVLENLGLIDRVTATWDRLSQTALNITEDDQ